MRPLLRSPRHSTSALFFRRHSALAILAALVGANPHATAGVIQLVSRSDAGVVGNGPSKSPGLTPDGRFVAFESSASNLVPGDTNGVDDIFVRDLVGGTIERVSVTSSGAQADGRCWSGNFDFTRGTAISADGNRILFSSTATNFAGGPVFAGQHVYLRDRVAGTTVDVADPVPSTQHPRGEAIAISGDGNHAIFVVTSAPGPLHLEWYVRDLRTGNALLLWDALPPESGHDATISAGGRWIVLQHTHVLVSLTHPTGESSLRLYDRDSDGNGVYDEPGTVVSQEITPTTSGVDYASPKLSSSGRFLVYTVNGLSTPGTSYIHRLDRDVDGNGVFDEAGLVSDTVVGTTFGYGYGIGAQISDDGQSITNQTIVPNTIQHLVELLDVSGAPAELLNFSNSSCAPSTAAGATRATGLSGDARFVAWDSMSTDLDPADTQSTADVYVVDRQATYACDCHDVELIGTATPNSHFPSGASLGYSGSRSYAADDLVLEIGSCPPGEPGFLFYGPVQADVPFGNGHRYVGAGATGIVRLMRFAAAADGSRSVAVHHASTQSTSLPFAVGTTVYFQGFFFDPLGGGAGFNLTNGLKLKFCP